MWPDSPFTEHHSSGQGLSFKDALWRFGIFLTEMLSLKTAY